MNHFHISSILITKTNIRTVTPMNHTSVCRFIIILGILLNQSKWAQDPYDGFPIHVEFRHVEIDTNLNKYNIDKIYEFNKILQEQTIVKTYVGKWNLDTVLSRNERGARHIKI